MRDLSSAVYLSLADGTDRYRESVISSCMMTLLIIIYRTRSIHWRSFRATRLILPHTTDSKYKACSSTAEDIQAHPPTNFLPALHSRRRRSEERCMCKRARGFTPFTSTFQVARVHSSTFPYHIFMPVSAHRFGPSISLIGGGPAIRLFASSNRLMISSHLSRAVQYSKQRILTD